MLASRIALAQRPAVGRASRTAQKGRVVTRAVAVDTSKLSAEQLAFLERKRSESGGSASPAPTRGRSSAPAAGGLSAEQQAFLARQRQERSASPVVRETRGRGNSARPNAVRSSRPSSAAPAYSAPAAAAPSYSAPAPAGGLSAEQQAFLDRQRRERSASPAPRETRGRGNSARPNAVPSARPSSRPSSAAPAAASYSAPAASSGSYRFVTPDEVSRLSAEQCDFLERKRGGF